MAMTTESLNGATRSEDLSSERQHPTATIDRGLGVLELELDGTISGANEKLLRYLGYELEALRGRHHSILVGVARAGDTEYRQFWDRLVRGELVEGQFAMLGGTGQELWVQASYTPTLDKYRAPHQGGGLP